MCELHLMAVQMDVVCEQGCRPVGQAATVTSSLGGTMLELNGQTALVVVSYTRLFVDLPLSCRRNSRLHTIGKVYAVCTS